MKRINAYTKIRLAMLVREREVLTHIRKLNKKFEGFRPHGPMGLSWWNALERLEKKGKIFYRHTKTLRTYGMSGYWIRTKTRTK